MPTEAELEVKRDKIRTKRATAKKRTKPGRKPGLPTIGSRIRNHLEERAGSPVGIDQLAAALPDLSDKQIKQSLGHLTKQHLALQVVEAGKRWIWSTNVAWRPEDDVKPTTLVIDSLSGLQAEMMKMTLDTPRNFRLVGTSSTGALVIEDENGDGKLYIARELR